MTGLSGTERAQELRSYHTEQAFDGITHSLGSHLDIPNVASTLAEFLPKLQQSIIEPAADLYQRISCSRHQYSLEAPVTQPGQRLEESNLSEWHLKNTKDWVDVSSEDDAHGVLSLLFPGLRRHTTCNGAGLAVVRPLVLVYDESSPDPPSGADSKPSDKPSEPKNTTSELPNSPSSSDRTPGQGRSGQSLHAAPKSSATDPGVLRSPVSSKPSREKGRRHSGSAPTRSSSLPWSTEPFKRMRGNNGPKSMGSSSRRSSKDSDADRRAFTASLPPNSPTQTRPCARRSETSSLSSDDSSRSARGPTPSDESRSRHWPEEDDRRDQETTPRGTTENLPSRERSGSSSSRSSMELASGGASSPRTRGRSENAGMSQVRSSAHPDDPGHYSFFKSFVVSDEIVSGRWTVSQYSYE